ncbi:MAG: zinc-finger domain-containing protein [Gammaproteobacteria bacterium]
MKTRHGAVQEHLTQPNAKNHYEVTRQDVPLHCPMPGMYLWNSHPKVYLPITATGKAKCPYCGALYTLTDFEPAPGR